MATITRAAAPRRFWIIGALATAWNGFGCLDFALTNMRDPAWMAQMPPAMVDYVDAMPAWAILTWGLSVSAGLLGSLLLLARSARAVSAFALSVLGLALTSLHQLLDGTPAAMNTPANWLMTALIWIAALSLLRYALRMRREKVLG